MIYLTAGYAPALQVLLCACKTPGQDADRPSLPRQCVSYQRHLDLAFLVQVQLPTCSLEEVQHQQALPLLSLLHSEPCTPYDLLIDCHSLWLLDLWGSAGVELSSRPLLAAVDSWLLLLKWPWTSSRSHIQPYTGLRGPDLLRCQHTSNPDQMLI